jgi:glycosyltransferase involved in cell wall biosynthesis
MNVSTPKVIIDARMVFPHPHGIGRYVKNIATGLAEISKSRELGYQPLFLVDQRFSGLIPSCFETVPLKSEFLKPSEILEIPQVLKRWGADLYHSPSFSSLAYSPCPWIVTVHDLNHLQFGNWKQKAYYRLILRRFSRQARALLTVSEFAKTELCDWLSFPPSRIEVVYNALDPGFARPLEDLSGGSGFRELSASKGWALEAGNYFLCLSNPKPHKNLGFLIRAYAQAISDSQKRLPPLMLSADRSELGEIPANVLDSIVFTSKLTDVEARLALENARAAFFPSVYEGFGLPPLEAIVSGTPVFVSDIPPHREGLRDFQGPWVSWLKPNVRSDWVDAWLQISRETTALATPEEMRVSPRFASERKQALERYSVKRLAEHMDRIYRAQVKTL